jgi:hypothetical protein
MDEHIVHTNSTSCMRTHGPAHDENTVDTNSTCSTSCMRTHSPAHDESTVDTYRACYLRPKSASRVVIVVHRF